MKQAIPLPVLVASILIAATGAPGSLTAQQQVERSTTLGPAEESIPVQPKRISAWGRITADEIAETNAHTAYDVVSRLRATWLRPRGISSLAFRSGVRVYLDGMRIGGVAELRQISANSIRSVQYLDGVEATLRFGTGNGDGAIVLTTRL